MSNRGKYKGLYIPYEALKNPYFDNSFEYEQQDYNKQNRNLTRDSYLGPDSIYANGGTLKDALGRFDDYETYGKGYSKYPDGGTMRSLPAKEEAQFRNWWKNNEDVTAYKNWMKESYNEVPDPNTKEYDYRWAFKNHITPKPGIEMDERGNGVHIYGLATPDIYKIGDKSGDDWNTTNVQRELNTRKPTLTQLEINHTGGGTYRNFADGGIIGMYEQDKSYNCGPFASSYFLAQKGINVSGNKMERIQGATKKDGVNPRGLIRGLEEFYKGSYLNNATIDDLKKNSPALVDYQYNGDGHYSVVNRVDDDGIHIFNVAKGKEDIIPQERFKKKWHDKDTKGNPNNGFMYFKLGGTLKDSIGRFDDYVTYGKGYSKYPYGGEYGDPVTKRNGIYKKETPTLSENLIKKNLAIYNKLKNDPNSEFYKLSIAKMLQAPLSDNMTVYNANTDTHYKNLEPIDIQAAKDETTDYVLQSIYDNSMSIKKNDVYKMWEDAGKPNVRFGKKDEITNLMLSNNPDKEYRAHYSGVDNTMFVEDTTGGNTNYINDYFAELPHAFQNKIGTLSSGVVKDWINDPYFSVRGYNKQYSVPGTIEYEAHNIIQPQYDNMLRTGKIHKPITDFDQVKTAKIIDDLVPIKFTGEDNLRLSNATEENKLFQNDDQRLVYQEMLNNAFKNKSRIYNELRNYGLIRDYSEVKKRTEDNDRWGTYSLSGAINNYINEKKYK